MLKSHSYLPLAETCVLYNSTPRKSAAPPKSEKLLFGASTSMAISPFAAPLSFISPDFGSASARLISHAPASGMFVSASCMVICALSIDDDSILIAFWLSSVIYIAPDSRVFIAYPYFLSVEFSYPVIDISTLRSCAERFAIIVFAYMSPLDRPLIFSPSAPTIPDSNTSKPPSVSSTAAVITNGRAAIPSGPITPPMFSVTSAFADGRVSGYSLYVLSALIYSPV